MVELINNWIKISKDDLLQLKYCNDLSFSVKEKKIKSKGRVKRLPSKIQKLYSIIDGDMYIPIGLIDFIADDLKHTKVIDKRNSKSDLINIDLDDLNKIENLESILEGITLRKYQEIAVRKIIYNKRCIINACTGFGKTEVMCATVKVLTKLNKNVCPTVLIFEPTIKLVEDTVKRFKKYGIDAYAYSDGRDIILNTVNVCHPKSLCNDLENNPNLLDCVEVLFGDECHHFQSETMRKPLNSMDSLVYCIGVSASAISQEHCNGMGLRDFTYEELLIIGATGRMVLNVTTNMLISNGALANPILLRLDNWADEYIDNNKLDDWHTINSVCLQSPKRTDLICLSAKFFSDNDRKTLILVNTISWSRVILKRLYELGNSEVLASYGSHKFEIYDGDDFVSLPKDSMSRFDSGEFKILVGTSHLYEGADIKNLDTLILAFGGKGERLQIQGLGRALRKTKTKGTTAYIVDFTDSHNKVLCNQSNLRYSRYVKIIGIPKERIYNCITLEEMRDIFEKYKDV